MEDWFPSARIQIKLHWDRALGITSRKVPLATPFREGFGCEVMAMTVGYANITPEDLAAHAAIRAESELQAACAGDLGRWFFAVTDIHQALTAALVSALSGTMGIGALVPRDQAAWIERLDATGEGPFPRERIAPFAQLVERAQDPVYANNMGGTLVLTAQHQKDLIALNTFRDDLAHVKPRSWSLEVAGLPRIVGAAAAALDQLYKMHPLRMHTEDDLVGRAEEAIGTILLVAAEAAEDAADAATYAAATADKEGSTQLSAEASRSILDAARNDIE